MAPGDSIFGQCPWTWDSLIFRSAPSFPKCSRVKCFEGVWGFLLGIVFGALPLGIAFSDLPLLGIEIWGLDFFQWPLGIAFWASALGHGILTFFKVLQGQVCSKCSQTVVGDWIFSIALGHSFF